MKPLKLNKSVSEKPTEPKSPMLGSKERMIELMTEVLNESGTEHAMHDLDPARIVGVRLVSLGDGERALKPLHRLNVFDHKWPIEGMIGHVNERHFKGTIRSALIQYIQGLHNLQPGQWRFVAARVSDSFKQKWQRVSTGRGPSLLPPIGEDGMPEKSNRQQTRNELINVPYLKLEVVAAELSGSPPVDHEHRRTGRMTGKHYMYSTRGGGGLLQHMPQVLRDMRQTSIEIVNDYFEGDFEEVELSENDIREIWNMHEANVSKQRLATLFCVTEKRIEEAILDGDVRYKPKPKTGRRSKAAT